MTRYLAILAATTLLACSGEKGGDTGAPAGDDDDDACANAATAVHPTQGDPDVYYRTAVRFSLDTEDPNATIAVSDVASGTEVPGTTTVEGTTVEWRGEPLEPTTEYNATISFDCGEASVTFTTSPTGGTAGDVVGYTYSLDVAGGQWIEPPDVGTLIATQLEGTQIFVSVTETTPSTVTMFGAIGENDAQDRCAPTIEFPAADYANPYFELQAELLPLVISGVQVDIQNLDLSGAFAPDGSRIQGASLAGAVDTRPLGPAFELDDDPNAVCELVGTFNIPCEPCPDGEVYCLSVRVENIEAAQMPGLVLEERTEEDILADPECTPQKKK